MRSRADDRLVGARILASESSELLMELTLAIKYDLTAQELTSTLHPYLTLSEGAKLAALTFEKDVRKLSCCAGQLTAGRRLKPIGLLQKSRSRRSL